MFEPIDDLSTIYGGRALPPEFPKARDPGEPFPAHLPFDPYWARKPWSPTVPTDPSPLAET